MAEDNTSTSNIPKLNSEAELTDTIIAIGHKRIPAHRSILSAKSEYFNTLFSSENDLKSKEIILNDLNSEAVESIIAHFYSSEISINKHNVENILTSSCFLQIEDIKNLCCKFIKETLDICKSVYWKAISVLHACGDLKDYIDHFIRTHFVDFINNEEFLLISVDNFESIIGHGKLHVPSEEMVFTSVMRWINYDSKQRSPYLNRLLGKVRLSLLGMEYLNEVVMSDSLIKRDGNSVVMVENARMKLEEKGFSDVELKRKLSRKSEKLFAAQDRTYSIGDTIYKDIPCPWDHVWKDCGIACLKGVVYLVKYDQQNCAFECGLKMISYNLLSKKWMSLADVPLDRPLEAYNLIPFQDELFLFTVRPRSDNLVKTDVVRYSTVDDSWTTRESVPLFKYFSSVVPLGDYIYAFSDDLFYGPSMSKRCARFNPITYMWIELPPRYFRRHRYGVEVYEGEIYVVGGWNEESGFPKTGEKYNPKTNSWSCIADILPAGRYDPSLVVVNSLLYALGGTSTNNPGDADEEAPRYATVQVYDKTLDTWSLSDDLQTPCQGQYLNLNIVPVPEPYD